MQHVNSGLSPSAVNFLWPLGQFNNKLRFLLIRMAQRAGSHSKIPSCDAYFETIQCKKKLPHFLQQSLTSAFKDIPASSFPQVPGGKGIFLLMQIELNSLSLPELLLLLLTHLYDLALGYIYTTLPFHLVL